VKTIIHVVDINVPREQVYAALTTQKGLAGWWTSVVKAEERIGGVLEFTFNSEFGPRMKITQLQPPGLVVWECVGGHEPWIGNTFHFEIAAQDPGSRLRFRQDYSRELSDDQYGIYNFNWGYYLESLRLCCETGAGKPYMPVAKAGALGI
jgi:Activator of Hsp90 ATPase homolog 1-like protein